MRISGAKLLVLLVMSAVGIWASSTVLVIFYTLHEQLPLCPTGTFFGMSFDCGAVLTSPYSVVFGVPLEILALAYFLVNVGMVLLVALGSEKSSNLTMNVLFGWRFIGILLVPYLVAVELFIIHAICVYCTVMHVAILADFAVISYLLFFRQDSALAEAEEGAVPAGQTGPR